mgnify:CR=1 FL=1
MKKILTAVSLIFLWLFSLGSAFGQDEITYGFIQDPNDPLDITAVAYPNFTSNNVTIPTAVFSFLLPAGTVTDPAIPELPGSGMFIDITGTWTAQLMTETLYDNIVGTTGGLMGNDVYQVVLQNSPSPNATAGVPIELFSFRLPNDCMNGNVEVLTNDSPIQQGILNNFGANFNNQMSVSIDDAPAFDIYVGNDPTSFSLPCMLLDADISIVKAGTFQDENGDGFAQPGETITYAFTVTNTGNAVLTNVTVTDPLVTVSGGPLATLAIGASDNSTFTASYTVTQADIDNGGVTNQATATGDDPNGDPVSDDSDDNSPLEDDPTVTPLPQNPAIAIIKTGTFQDESGDGLAQPGETITYAFTVTNTGNVTLTDVTVTDPLVTVSGGPLATLAVGASDNTTFTASYTITQADIDDGGVTNQATATGDDPNGDPVSDDSDDNSPLEDDPTVTPLPIDPGIAIIKTGTFQDESGDGFAQAGETITYAFTVTNTGNVTLTNVTVTDPLVTVSGGPLATLAVGATDNSTFTAVYVLTQADIDNGQVTNQATATGDDPNGDPVSDDSDDNSPLEDDPTVTPLPINPGIAIIKTGTFQDESGDGFAQVGETITYAFTVSNTGDVDLTNVTVTDPLVTVSGGPIALLAIGASDNSTFTATYTITQADIDNGGVTNQATATGTDPLGDPVSDDSDDNSPLEDDPTVTPLPQNPAIAIIKTGTFQDENGDGFAQVGETITYAFTVTNTGNVTLTDVTVTDPLVTVSGGPLATLAVGATDNSTFTASYTITQADIDDGGVTNQATATGDDPNGDPVSDDSDDNSPLEDDPTVTPLPQNPAIAIIKMGTFQDENGDGMAQVGETISYNFTVTNTGNVTLTNVTVTDPLVTVSGGPIGTLAVGATDNTTFTASYVVTQADIDNGGVTNQATATGDDPDGDPVTDLSDDNSVLEDDPTVTVLIPEPVVKLLARVMLQGAMLGANDGLMRDDLRIEGHLPATEPYDAMVEFMHVNNNVDETVGNPAMVFDDFGGNSIVDWVFVELRSALDPAEVVATRSGLVQRDGDVVDMDGVSPLCFRLIEPGSYYVAVRHRNHLGTMTASDIALTTDGTVVDFTNTAADLWENTPAYDGLEQIIMGGQFALWAGNTNVNQTVIFAGQSNDEDPIFNEIDQAAGNIFGLQTYILPGYHPGDVNMDGNSIFAGQNNDVDAIFNNVDGHPRNLLRLQTFVIPEQLAE